MGAVLAAAKIYIFSCDELGTPDASTRRTFLDMAEDDGEPDVRPWLHRK